MLRLPRGGRRATAASRRARPRAAREAARGRDRRRTRRNERAAARAPETGRRGDRYDPALGHDDIRPAALGGGLLPPSPRRRAVQRNAEDVAKRHGRRTRRDPLASLGCGSHRDRLRHASRLAPVSPHRSHRRRRSYRCSHRDRGAHGHRARACETRLARIHFPAGGSATRRSRAPGPGTDRGPGRRRRADRRIAREIRRLAPLRGHRQRKDRGLPSADRARARVGPRRARARARDRADAPARRALPRTARGTHRRPALLARRRRAARGLAGRGLGPGKRRNRNALRRIHADAGARPRRRRRGARCFVQAAGRIPLLRPRPRCCTRAARRRAGRARFGDAFARDARQRHRGALREGVASAAHGSRRASRASRSSTFA